MKLGHAAEQMSAVAHPYQTWIAVGGVAFFTVLSTWILVRVIRKVTEHVESGAKAKLDRSKAGTDAYSAAEELLRRTKTASKLVSNVVVWLQVGISAIIVLGILGVNLTALIASAGVMAAVLTFSAQNIIKDVITGAFMVAEDQLDVGDFVDIGTGHAVVEFVGLRVTQVRDDYGVLWSVRNGDIDKVGNSSRGWMNSVIDVPFGPDADLEKGQALVLDAIRGAIEEFDTGGAIISQPICVGVIALDGEAATMRFMTRMNASEFLRLDPLFREGVQRAFADEKAGARLARNLVEVVGQEQRRN